MAKQKGIIKLKGTIGDITFYKSQDGYLVRERGGVDKKRIEIDPAFQRTRENNAEFGRAGQAGKLLRMALRPLLLSADSRMVSRLTQLMMRVIKADELNARGERNVMNGNPELLLGFEFNKRSQLGSTLFTPFTTNIDRATGESLVEVPEFVPSNMIVAPKGTSHFKIISGCAEVDFKGITFVLDTSESDVIPWNATSTTVINLFNSVTPNSEFSLFLVVGIEFFQEINGEMYPLRNRTFNPLSIVNVEAGM